MFSKRGTVLAGSLFLAGVIIWVGCTAGAGVPNTAPVGTLLVGGLGNTGGTGGVGGVGGIGGVGGSTGPCTANTTWQLTFNDFPVPGGLTGQATAMMTLDNKGMITQFTALTGMKQPFPSAGDKVVVTPPGSSGGSMNITILYSSPTGAGESIQAQGSVDQSCITWTGFAQYQFKNATGVLVTTFGNAQGQVR